MKDNFIKNKKIVPTHELYGIDPRRFINMNYVDVLLLKIKLGNKAVEEILKVNYMERDTIKMNKVLNAIKFNEELLKEIGLSK